jgi:L-ascorbate metabolism protein UlaG (beta-lactamase superfamily)
MKPIVFITTALLIVTGSSFSQEPEAPPAKKSPPRIAYLANAGISVNTADRGVLIDVLFRETVGEFAGMNAATLGHVETGGQPFDETKVVLVTSAAADHFDAASVARFLRNNSAAHLVATPQAAAAVKEKAEDFSAIEDRVKSVTFTGNDPVSLEFDDIKVTVVKLTHDGDPAGQTEEYGYVLDFAEKRLLHVGHARLDDQAKAALLATAVGVDAACVPYWWVTEEPGRQFLRGPLAAKAVIAHHIPPADAERMEAELKAHPEGISSFIRPLASRRL